MSYKLERSRYKNTPTAMSPLSAQNLFSKYIHLDKEMRVSREMVDRGLGKKSTRSTATSHAIYRKVLQDDGGCIKMIREEPYAFCPAVLFMFIYLHADIKTLSPKQCSVHCSMLEGIGLMAN